MPRDDKPDERGLAPIAVRQLTLPLAPEQEVLAGDRVRQLASDLGPDPVLKCTRQESIQISVDASVRAIAASISRCPSQMLLTFVPVAGPC